VDGGSRPALTALAASTVQAMRCPACGSFDDKVVDSRQADDGGAIRRRRECLGCGRRYTTFERVEEAPLVVVKRSGERETFDLPKLVAGVAAAAKNRLSVEQITVLAAEIEDEARLAGPEITTQEIGIAVLGRLGELDHVTYLRFASVYKGFEDLTDFEREVGLLAKATPPKQR
jgi:transcriptional repressor NrdR